MKLLGKTPQTRRVIFALGLVFASLSASVYAGVPSADVSAAIIIYNAAQKTAATKITSLATASAGQAGSLMQIIASGTGADLNLPGDGPADATYILQNIPTGNISLAGGDMVKTWYIGAAADVGGSAIISGSLGKLTAAAAAASNLELAGDGVGSGALDSAENVIIGDAITEAPTDLQDILVKALTTYDPNPINQAGMLSLKITSAALGSSGGATLFSIAQAIAASDTPYLTSSGTFLYTLAVKEPLSVNRQAVVEGFTSGDNLAAINTIATALGVAQANTTVAFLGNSDVFIALVTSGSGAGDNVPSLVTDVTEALLPGVVKSSSATVSASYATDSARGTLSSAFITDFPGYANTIASAAANELVAPATDSFLLTADLVANSNVKLAVSASNNIVGIAEAVADQFTLSDVTAANSTNIQAKEGAAEAGIKALGALVPSISGSAGTIAADIANQVLASSTTSAAKVAFATNFITAIDTKNSNTPAINASDRAYAAIGLAQDYDTNGIANAAAAIAKAAVETYDVTTLDLTNVAQPILLAYATTSATETESIASAIAQDPDNYAVGSSSGTYTPAFVAAQLILASRQPGSVTALNQAIVGEVAIGVAGNPLTAPSGADTLITALAGDLSAVTSLTALKYVESDLIGSGSFSGTYKDTQVITDITATGGAPASESGTLAAVLAQANTGDTTAIAYAAAAGTGVTTDAIRYVIADDLVGITPADDIAISGSLGTLIGSTTTADKGVFAADVSKVAVKFGNTADVSNIALAVANSVPTGDSTLNTDLEYIVNSSLTAFTTKTTAEVANAVDAVALNYTGTPNTYNTLSGAGGLTYTQIAAIAGAIVTNPLYTVAAAGNTVASTLIAAEIRVNGYSPSTVVSIAQAFTLDIPASTLAIATVSTQSSSYLVALTPQQSGSIGAAIAANLPTSGALISKVPALSGSVALIVANNAGTGHGTFDDTLATVAGIFATSGVPATDYVTIAASLGNAAGNATMDQHDSALAAIGAAFAPALAAESSDTALLALMKELINVNGGVSAADVYGAIYAASGAGSNSTIAGELFTAAKADLTAAEIVALGLTTSSYDALLTSAASDANSGDFASIDPDETPVINL